MLEAVECRGTSQSEGHKMFQPYPSDDMTYLMLGQSEGHLFFNPARLMTWQTVHPGTSSTVHLSNIMFMSQYKSVFTGAVPVHLR